MNEILQAIQSPVWWFTAVVVGLIIGVISSFARDWLSATVAKYSANAKTKRENRNHAKQAEIKYLSEHREDLAIELLVLLWHLALFSVVILMGVFAATTIIESAKTELSQFERSWLKLGAVLLVGVVGFLCWLAYTITGQSELVRRSYNQYRQNRMDKYVETQNKT